MGSEKQPDILKINPQESKTQLKVSGVCKMNQKSIKVWRQGGHTRTFEKKNEKQPKDL